MHKIKNNLKYIKMGKNLLKLSIFLVAIGMYAQDSVTTNKRIKIDGVAVVIGKNIVLHSDVDKFKKELAQRMEGKIEISDCEILEEIMTQKLIAHHAVVDSVEISESEIESEVERTISYFSQQMGSMEKVLKMYGFNDEDDLREELGSIQREQLLIRKERSAITEKIDVTPEEVRTYFKDLEKDNNLPEFSAEIELAQIVKYLKPTEEETTRVVEKLRELKKEIENGYSFRLKALINSNDPAVSGNGAGSGGKYTITRESGFIKEFKEVAFSLDEGEISDPFESGFGFHIIQVEKIRGQERDVRHILLQPKISEEQLKTSKEELAAVRYKIIKGEMTFEEAVKKYSEDPETKNNNGMILNSDTNDTKFDLTLMGPELYGRVNNLKVGDITEPFFEEIRGGEKMHKIILMKSKDETHKADFVKDYEKIQRLTLQKKQEETIEKWVEGKIGDTYIKIGDDFKACPFEKNWKKD